LAIYIIKKMSSGYINLPNSIIINDSLVSMFVENLHKQSYFKAGAENKYKENSNSIAIL